MGAADGRATSNSPIADDEQKRELERVVTRLTVRRHRRSMRYQPVSSRWASTASHLHRLAIAATLQSGRSADATCDGSRRRRGGQRVVFRRSVRCWTPRRSLLSSCSILSPTGRFRNSIVHRRPHRSGHGSAAAIAVEGIVTGGNRCFDHRRVPSWRSNSHDRGRIII